ncbi:MAG: class I SAM-dependent methyltransferase [Anaerolineae bacterium]|nr:class I SAM-dependent methyltransferase [Anaerolineae bacterium]
MSKISLQRWQQAQRWEQDHWDRSIAKGKRWRNLGPLKTLIKNLVEGGRGDDRNHWWAEKFENYHYVPHHLNNVVEFGCGPFTNLRIILQGREARHVFASDPLAKHYVSYNGFHLSNKWKAREYLIDDHPLEEAPFASDYFDLVVCINVLDHVRDPDMCLTQLARVVAPTGLIILGQDLTNEDDLKAVEQFAKETGSDIGHPHSFSDSEYLLSYFRNYDDVLKKVLPREEGLAPFAHFGTLIYVGRKIQDD